jgi:hypothetical protein
MFQIGLEAPVGAPPIKGRAGCEVEHVFAPLLASLLEPREG